MIRHYLIFAVLFNFVFLTSSEGNICRPSSELIQALSSSSTSDILNLTFSSSDEPSLNLISCDEIAVNSQWTGGKLILSDSPEYPNGTGKLYEHLNLPPTIQSNSSSNRIFMYHVNGRAEGNLRFSVLIQNAHNSTAAVLKLLKSGVGGPSSNYLYTGKVTGERWMKSTESTTIIIPPGGIVELDPTYSSHSVTPGLLLHGIWDYSINTPHSLFLCSLEEYEEDPVDGCLSSQLLPKDSHVRGTFNNAEKILDYSVFDFKHSAYNLELARTMQFPIGDGLADEFAYGEDATDGSPQLNSGNYGVLYKIPVKVKAPVSYLVNPRGGMWSGVMKVSGVVHLMPANANSVSDNTQGVLVGSFNGTNSSEDILLYMPVGGSNLPIRIAVIV